MHPVQLAASEFIALERSPLFYVCDGQPVCGCLSIVHQSCSACLWMSQHCASWSACLWLSKCCASVLVSLSVDVKESCIYLGQPVYGCQSVVLQSWSACLWMSECCASVLVSLSMAVKVLCISLCQPAYGC